MLITSADAQFTDDTTQVIKLRSGETLISAAKPTTVDAGRCVVSIAQGCVVLVSRTPDVVKVTTLWDGVFNRVKLNAPNRLDAIVHSGSEIILADSTRNLKLQCAADQISRRRALLLTHTDNQTVQTSEVSLPTVINNDALMHSIFASNHKHYRELAARIAKMTASISLSTAGHGVYNILSDH